MGPVFAHRHRGQRQFRARQDPFIVYDDKELYRRYRFDRNAINYITDMIKDDISHTKRNHALSALHQVLVALRFYATGSMQQVVGDTVGVSQPVVSTSITRVTDALLQHLPDHVHFPEGERLAQVSLAQDFKVHQKSGEIITSHVMTLT